MKNYPVISILSKYDSFDEACHIELDIMGIDEANKQFREYVSELLGYCFEGKPDYHPFAIKYLAELTDKKFKVDEVSIEGWFKMKVHLVDLSVDHANSKYIVKVLNKSHQSQELCFSSELAEDMKAMHGFDITREMINVLWYEAEEAASH